MINKFIKLLRLPGLCFAGMLLFPAGAQADHHVVMLVPSKGQDFWKLVIQFAEAAAHDLDIDLEIIVADNRFDKRKAFVEVLNRTDKVDAVVIKIEYARESQFLDLAEQAQVPLLTFNTSFDPDMAKVVGKPRERYPYWLGEIFPNEVETAAATTRILLDQARRKKLLDEQDRLQVVAIAAEKDSHPNDDRMQGFLESMESYEDVILHQVAYSHWKKEKARFAFLGLMKRYPQTRVVWAVARDRAIRSEAKEQGLVPGTDFVINSNRLLGQTLQSVKSGELAVAAGGHYVDGAWVMVLLHDYFHGRDFAEEDVRITTKMAIVTQDNVDHYLSKLIDEKLSKENIEKIDFTQFSKVRNPELKSYQFSIDMIFDKL